MILMNEKEENKVNLSKRVLKRYNEVQDEINYRAEKFIYKHCDLVFCKLSNWGLSTIYYREPYGLICEMSIHSKYFNCSREEFDILFKEYEETT